MMAPMGSRRTCCVMVTVLTVIHTPAAALVARVVPCTRTIRPVGQTRALVMTATEPMESLSDEDEALGLAPTIQREAADTKKFVALHRFEYRVLRLIQQARVPLSAPPANQRKRSHLCRGPATITILRTCRRRGCYTSLSACTIVCCPR